MTIMNVKEHELDSVYLDPATGTYYFLTAKEDATEFAFLTIISAGQVVRIKDYVFLTHGKRVGFDPVVIQHVYNEFLTNTFGNKQAAPVEVAIKETKQQNPMEVVRFIRPINHYGNMYGVTLVFSLDYDKRTVDVGISICNGDNFDRKIGIEIARNGDNFIRGLHMPDDIFNRNSDLGLVEWFIECAPEENANNPSVEWNIGAKTIELMLGMYSCSKYVFGR